MSTPREDAEEFARALMELACRTGADAISRRRLEDILGSPTDGVSVAPREVIEAAHRANPPRPIDSKPE